MRRLMLALPAVFALMALNLSAGQPAAAGKPQIRWFGQSFFIVTSSKGTRVALDPHAIPEYGRFLGLKADAVLISHLHNDHTQKEVLENYKDKDFKVIPGLLGRGQATKWNLIDEKFKDFRIRSVGTYHDDVGGMKSGKNTVFILEVDGWKIAHLGDLGHQLTPAQLKKIGPVDVLLIPVGGVYTLNGGEAREVVAKVKPREFVIPMHYGNARYEDLLPVDEFIDESPLPVALSKDDKLILNKDAKANVAFVKRQIAATDNNLILERDAGRPHPVVVVLHWWPQQRKLKKTGK
jgi:L-ascorbate metabolism protein UlaG (beta-lactamase superfamily)